MEALILEDYCNIHGVNEPDREWRQMPDLRDLVDELMICRAA